MHLPRLCLITTLLLASRLASAQTRPEQEPMLVAEIARSAAWGIHDNAAALLARTDLSDSDRKEITAIVQRADAAADTLVKQAGDQSIDPKITRAELAALQNQYASPVNAEYKKFTRSRGDLDWMSGRAAGIQAIEDPAIIAKTHEYLDKAEDAGIDAAGLKAIAAALDDARAQIEKDRKLMLAAYVLAADAPARQRIVMSFDGTQFATLAKARAALRAPLKPAQIAALEWQFLKSYNGIPTYAKVVFSTQAQTLPAPEDGSYSLETYPDRKELAKITLKKGDPIGFHERDNSLTAVAADKEFPLPAGTTTYWMKSEE